MSVAPRKRQLATKVRRVVKGQQLTHAPPQKVHSFDNLVGRYKQGWRHRKPKRLRSFEIDDHQILCWQLDGEF
jgi:hypothetical protein